MESTVKINPESISDDVYDSACSVLNSGIRRIFAIPGVAEEYKRWLETDEGKRAGLSGERGGKRKKANNPRSTEAR